MMTSINAVIAAEHRADLLRAAGDRYASQPAPAGGAAQTQTVALRLTRADEAHVVGRLAELDDAPRLEGQALLALIDGEAVAALSLEDGRVVANPFVRTEDAVALLRLRARHLWGLPRRRRLRPKLRPRFV
jgi:hypothetical protein